MLLSEGDWSTWEAWEGGQRTLSATGMKPLQQCCLVKQTLVGKASFPLSPSGSTRPLPSVVYNKLEENWFILNPVLEAGPTVSEPQAKTLIQIKIQLKRLKSRNIPLFLWIQAARRYMLQNIVPTSNITTPRARHSLQSDISAEFGSLSFSSSQWCFFFFFKDTGLSELIYFWLCWVFTAA